MSGPKEKPGIVELAQQLIRFRTTSDNPKEIDACIDFIQRYFSGKGLVVRKHVYGGKPSLIVSFSDSNKPELFLVGHIDVVPAADTLFAPKVKGNRLYGRGSCDDKSAVAIMLELMRHYSLQPKKPDMALMIVSDEEIGSEHGTQPLVKTYSSKFAIVLDGGRPDEIVCKEKGLMHLKISTEGRSAHGSTPWKGENALDKLIVLYLKLKRKFPYTGRWRNTMSLGTMKGGMAVNQVPDHAEMELDMRFISDKERDGLMTYLKSQKGFRIEQLSRGDLLDTDTRNRYILALRESAAKILPKKPYFGKISGATDARFFAERGIPAVLIMPLGYGYHSEQEYVDIKSTFQIYDILKDYIDNNIRKV